MLKFHGIPRPELLGVAGLGAEPLSVDIDEDVRQVSHENRMQYGPPDPIGVSLPVHGRILRPEADPDLFPRTSRRGGDECLNRSERRVEFEPVSRTRRDPHGTDIRQSDESRHEACLRIQVDRVRVSHLLDPALVHHHDPVRDGERLVLVMGNVDRGDPEPLLHFPDFHPYLNPELRVQVGQRLVEEQNVRLGHDGPRQRDPLLLSARELTRLALLEPRETHHFQGAVHPLFLFTLGDLPHLQAERDVVPHVHMGEQRVGLETHGGVSPVRRDVVHQPVVEVDLPFVRLIESRGGAERGGLPASRRSEQGNELALLDLQIQVVHRRNGIEAFGEIPENQSRHEDIPHRRCSLSAPGFRSL